MPDVVSTYWTWLGAVIAHAYPPPDLPEVERLHYRRLTEVSMKLGNGCWRGYMPNFTVYMFSIQTKPTPTVGGIMWPPVCSVNALLTAAVAALPPVNAPDSNQRAGSSWPASRHPRHRFPTDPAGCRRRRRALNSAVCSIYKLYSCTAVLLYISRPALKRRRVGCTWTNPPRRRRQRRRPRGRDAGQAIQRRAPTAAAPPAGRAPRRAPPRAVHSMSIVSKECFIT